VGPEGPAVSGYILERGHLKPLVPDTNGTNDGVEFSAGTSLLKPVSRPSQNNSYELIEGGHVGGARVNAEQRRKQVATITDQGE
jgi:hypothetical protein